MSFFVVKKKKKGHIHSTHTEKKNSDIFTLNRCRSIAAFHTPSPIDYVTFGRKLDATAQGVKDSSTSSFIQSAFPVIHYSYGWCHFFHFMVQRNRDYLGTDKTLKKNKKNTHLLCFPMQCYAIDSLRAAHAVMCGYMLPLCGLYR